MIANSRTFGIWFSIASYVSCVVWVMCISHCEVCEIQKKNIRNKNDKIKIKFDQYITSIISQCSNIPKLMRQKDF